LVTGACRALGTHFVEAAGWFLERPCAHGAAGHLTAYGATEVGESPSLALCGDVLPSEHAVVVRMLPSAVTYPAAPVSAETGAGWGSVWVADRFPVLGRNSQECLWLSSRVKQCASSLTAK
jgi:hypothetical protein